MKAEDSFRVVEKTYANGNTQYFVQECHKDYGWQNVNNYAGHSNLKKAKQQKEFLVECRKGTEVVSEKVVG